MSGRPMRVLAAMSGGVDSAVAAARAVDAGHDVTGVHLALSHNPQTLRTGARGCCTLEDARDARRAADVLGIPFYVWDMAERFHEDVVDDFVAEYAAGRTPNPCLRCNEKIKFAAVLDRALALGFDAVVTGHHARLGPTACCAAGRPRQGPVLRAGVLTPSSWRRRCSRSATRPRTGCGRAAERGLAVADKPDSHDICFIADGDTRGFLADGWAAARAGRRRDHRRGRRRARRGLRVHGRPARGLDLGVARRRRRPALRAGIKPVSRHRDGRHRAALAVSTRCAPVRPDWTGAVPDAAGRVRGAAAGARHRRSPARSTRRRTAACASALADAAARASPPGQAARLLRAGRRRVVTGCVGQAAVADARVTLPWPVARPPASVRCPAPTSPRRVRLVLGELPDLPHLPELPARGARRRHDRRTAALLVDLPVELTPAGWRLVPRPGRDLRRRRATCSSATSTR